MWLAIVGSRSLEECCGDQHLPAAQYAEGGPSCPKMTVYFLILESLARLSSRGLEGVVSGGAKGVDSLAEFIARDMSGLKTIVYRPEAEKGKSFAERAMKRNSRIVKQADMVLAFYDPRHPKSRGTSDTVAKARAEGKEVHVWHGHWERPQSERSTSSSPSQTPTTLPLLPDSSESASTSSTTPSPASAGSSG